ncbi:MAG: acylneuraminate cytidylyltransferase family protein, partial [Phycisphaerae bacterium]|nr:acylneuraminate cytidylyltransferase family protein [Phycisphaerae bacterium]
DTPPNPDRVLAVVIGRAGSKGLPGKNAMMLCGRPMIAHAIDHALASAGVDRIVVSTDGDAIADAARVMGVDVVRRPADLASDTATVDSAVRHAVEASGSSASIIVILYANIPIRPDGLIDRAIATLQATGADSVQSYERPGKYHPYWMVRLGELGEVRQWEANTVYRRQDLPPAFMPDGGVIAVRRESLFAVVAGQPHAFLGVDRRGIENPPGSVVDVDGPVDFRVAEAMLLERMSTTRAEVTR